MKNLKDYTKFRLMSDERLAALLDGKGSLFAVSCNKCFKEFLGDDEPELAEFTEFALKQGKTVAGGKCADFLCNKIQTEKLLERILPPDAECVFVISCGLGVQTVAGLANLPVYAAADSVGCGGHHGMALTKQRCEACGQCYLSQTGGICPIVDCSKSLINGQCGGARNGKCEVDRNTDCAWENIYRKLAETGRDSAFPGEPAGLRDYSKVSFKLVNDFVKSVREKRLEGFYGGLYPHEQKELSAHSKLTRISESETMESPEAVTPCANPEKLSADEIISIVKEKGIVGMGGAGFPTHIKLKTPKPVDTVLLNGCECEPLLTADHRVMLEYADDILAGLRLLLRATGASKGVVAIEDNKPDAVKLFQDKTADIPGIDVISVKTKYPQGAEKMLIKRALGRTVPRGGLPFDAGVIVSNVSTAKAVSDAVIKGLPLTERVVTVSGDKIKKPGNYIVRIGTTVKEVIDYCGGLIDSDTRILLGGPMMGTEIADLNVPVTKTTNGIVALQPVISDESPCIRCGRCVDACPMELLPLYYPQYAKKQYREGMADKAVNDCIECGCCDFICPSKIRIRDAVKFGKTWLRK